MTDRQTTDVRNTV